TALQYMREPGDLLGLVRHETDAAFVVTVQTIQQADSVVVRAGLDDARDRRHMWGNRFPRTAHTDMFAIENEIAANVADKLAQQLRHSSLSEADRQLLSRHTTRSEEAWQLYSEGRAYWYTPTSTAETYLKSLELYKQALQRDPNYALAYLGIADTYLSMAFEGWIPPKEGRQWSQEALDQAISIDSSLPERHYTSAGLLWWTGDWVAIEREFRAAIREVPTSVSAVR